MANKLKMIKPKYFTATITYIDNEKEEVKFVSWKYFDKFVEYFTTNCDIYQGYFSNIKTIKYCKEFVKFIEENNKPKETKQEDK